MMRCFVAGAACAWFLSFASAPAVAGTAEIITLEFDPGTLPNGSRVETEWFEDGFALIGNNRFASTSNGLATRTTRPVNGTDFLSVGLLDLGPTLTHQDSEPFSLLSVDLAEYSQVVIDNGNQTDAITMIGFFADGAIASVSLPLDMIRDGEGGLDDFQTFNLEGIFEDVVRVEFASNLFALDNIVITIPTPSTAFALIAAPMLSRRRRPSC